MRFMASLLGSIAPLGAVASICACYDDPHAALGTRAPEAGSPEAGSPAARCVGWKSGFARRVAIPVANPGDAVTDYQMKVVLDTKRLIEAGKLSREGRDLLVTASDGETPLPFWIEPRTLGSTSTAIWVRLKAIPAKGAAPTSLFVYYGNPSATASGDYSSTFVNAFADPMLIGGPGSPWRQEGPSVGAIVLAARVGDCTERDPCAHLWATRPRNPNGDSIALCQDAIFPPGSDYRLVFDVEIADISEGRATIMVGETAFYASSYEAHPNREVEADVRTSVVPDIQKLCLSAGLTGSDNPQRLRVLFRSLKVKKYREPEPGLGTVGAEQSCE